jgi:putative salt-induced outer membrane protein YdiY
MQYRNAALLALVAISFPLSCLADNVYLKSGDVLSGTITRIGPETIDLTTTYAGPLKIRRDAVRTLRSDAKVTIASPQGDVHTAYVAPIDATVGGTGWRESEVVIPPTGVAAVITPPPPAPVPAPLAAKAYYLDLEPYYIPIGPHWKNQFAFGIATTTGNTDSTTFNAEADFHYDTKPQEFTLKIGANYQVTDGVQTTNQAYLDSVYRRTFPKLDNSERWYAFGENHELYDAIKDISLRSTTSFGPGYYFFKGKKFNLDGRIGPAFVYERFFDGHQLTDFDALVGVRAEYNVNERSTLTEDALYTVAVEDASRYQLTSDTAYAIKLPEIVRGAGIKFDFRDDYDNSAGKGSKENDTRFTLALTLDF